MKRLVASILLALAAPAQAQITDGFVIQDIRIEGLQRISPGTVLSYLPVERGDRIDRSRAAEALRALYRTGFFNDVRLDRQDNILVISLEERPAIDKITLVGNKAIKTEDLLKGLRGIGLAEGETFDRLALDRVTQELTRQYFNRGRYNVRITPQVKTLDRNRVDLTITIAEGGTAKIRHINIVGNKSFTDAEIQDDFEARTTNWLSWYRRDDQYSREKLEGDLEKLRAFYLDRGYVEFELESAQVSISPDRESMYITANIREGEVFQVGEVKLTGEFVVPQQTLQQLVRIQPGETFSRKKLEQTSEAMTAILGNVGYAFAKVTPVPDVDQASKKVNITFLVEPGQRVYVRRILFKGHQKTRDEVLRREMRQLEGAWFSQAALDRSKVRLQRLGYFSKVEIETPKVAGADDQVDVIVEVEERAAGAFQFGVGYSQLQGLVTSLSLAQNNFLGRGTQVSLDVNRNDFFQRYGITYFDPYWTIDGVSRGFTLSYRELNQGRANLATYFTDVALGSMIFSIPVTETDRVNLSFGFDHTRVEVIPGFTPEEFFPLVEQSGTFNALRTSIGWARDTRDRFFVPTSGYLAQVGAELTLPPSRLQYFKLSTRYQHYFPLTKSLTLMLNGEVQFGDAYGGDSDGLPFFENFYLGGVQSVRGYRDNTLGPRLLSGGELLPVGGAFSVLGNVELIFPTPFVKQADTVRLAAFLDAGQVYKDFGSFDAGELRYTTGISLRWQAPVGPINISLAYPLNDKEGDDVERLQFSFLPPF